MKYGTIPRIYAMLLSVTIFSFSFSLSDSREKMILLDGSEYNSPANNKQFYASVWIGEYNGELYFAVPWVKSNVLLGLLGKRSDSYEGWLCKLSNGKPAKVVKLVQSDSDHIDILGMSDKFIYYYSDYFGSNLSIDTKPKILCCNVVTSEITLLYSPEIRGNANAYFSDDGSISIPLYAKTEQMNYLNVMGSAVFDSSEDTDETKQYVVGDKIYYLQLSDNDVVEHVMVRDAGGETREIPLENATRRSLIKTDRGLHIHNEGRKDLLYYVDEKGTVEKLFSVPCALSKSAVTVYKNTVYLSFMRYEKGAKGWSAMVGFENDNVKGTYRINLDDYSMEKISDMIFAASAAAAPPSVQV